MSMTMNLWMLTVILLSSVSCEKYKVPNGEACGKLSKGNGAFCAYTINGPERIMSEEEWDAEGRISMSLQFFGEIKKSLLEACERLPSCEKKDRKQIEDIFDSISR